MSIGFSEDSLSYGLYLSWQNLSEATKKQITEKRVDDIIKVLTE